MPCVLALHSFFGLCSSVQAMQAAVNGSSLSDSKPLQCWARRTLRRIICAETRSPADINTVAQHTPCVYIFAASVDTLILRVGGWLVVLSSAATGLERPVDWL